MEYSRAASGHADDRGGARIGAGLHVQHPRHPCVGDARREIQRRDGVSGKRPSASPAAVVADQWPQENPHPRFPDDAHDPRPGRAQVAAAGRARRHDAAEHLRLRAARGIRRSTRQARSHRDGDAADRRSRRAKFRRRRGADEVQGHHGARDYVINPWHDLSAGIHPPEEVTAVVEIPSGSRNKYELDKRSGLIRLDRVLYSSMHYPGDYGFIPRTLHEDGDPLDVLVRINEPTFPGCQIDCRPLGVLKMLDRGEPDDKILAVPCHDPYYHGYFDIADLSQHYLKEVEHFFHIYKDLEGRRVEILGWEKSEVAARVISDSIKRYQEKFHQVGT